MKTPELAANPVVNYFVIAYGFVILYMFNWFDEILNYVCIFYFPSLKLVITSIIKCDMKFLNYSRIA